VEIVFVGGRERRGVAPGDESLVEDTARPRDVVPRSEEQGDGDDCQNHEKGDPNRTASGILRRHRCRPPDIF